MCAPLDLSQAHLDKQHVLVGVVAAFVHPEQDGDGDISGRPPECQGAMTIAQIRKIAPSKKIERKILYGNAKKMYRSE